MGQTIGKDVRGELADAKLADLFSTERQFRKVTFEAFSDEPVLFQPLGIHAFTIVENDNGGTLSVKIGGQEDGST